MKKCLIIMGFLFLGHAHAQNYTRDAGLRVGDYFSATYRQHLDDEHATEIMLFIGRGGATLSVLKEYFNPALRHISENLYFQYGFGVHLGFRYMDHYKVLNRTYELDEWRFTPLLGVNGLAGLEYRFPDFPFMVGFDFKPYFEYSTVQIFNIYLYSIGLSVKYRF